MEMCAKLVAGSKELCRAECVLCWCPIGEEGLLLKARGNARLFFSLDTGKSVHRRQSYIGKKVVLMLSMTSFDSKIP